MRIGVVSDAHGNLAGFEAALAAIGPVDRLLFCGDAFGYYFEASKIMARLRALGATCILGNHDVILLGHLGFRVDPAWFGPDAATYRRKYGPALQRAVAEIDDDEVRWLASLYTHRELNLDGLRVLMVHGSPWGTTDEGVEPDSAKLPEFAALPYDLVLMGHTHLPFVRLEGTTTVVNAGSCGQPRDGDPRAAYVLIETQASGPPTCTVGRVAYDRAPLLAACQTVAPDVPLLSELLASGDPA